MNITIDFGVRGGRKGTITVRGYVAASRIASEIAQVLEDREVPPKDFLLSRSTPYRGWMSSRHFVLVMKGGT